MPNIYEIKLPNGKIAEIEADAPPNESVVRQLLLATMPKSPIKIAPISDAMKVDFTRGMDEGMDTSPANQRLYLRGSEWENWKKAKVGDEVLIGKEKLIKASDNEIIDPKDPGTDPIGAAERAFGTELPAVAAGAAGFGKAAEATKGLRNLGTKGKIANAIIGLGGGLLAGAGTSLFTRKGIAAISPEAGEQLARDQEKHPTASVVGGVAAAAPFFGIGPISRNLGKEALNRAVPAAIGAGIQGAQEIGSEQDGSLERILAAAGGNALFNSPTKIGGALIDSLNKKPITSKLGNASTKSTVTESNQAANDIALTPGAGEIPPVLPQPDLVSQALLAKANTKDKAPAGAPKAVEPTIKTKITFKNKDGDSITINKDSDIRGTETVQDEGLGHFEPMPEALTGFKGQADALLSHQIKQPVPIEERAAALADLVPAHQAKDTLLAETIQQGGPKKTGEKTKAGEEIVALGKEGEEVEYVKAGGEWVRADGSTVESGTVLNILENRLATPKATAPKPVKAKVAQPAKVEPVAIGPRDTSVSTGDGKPTSTEQAIIAEQRKLIEDYKAKEAAKTPPVVQEPAPAAPATPIPAVPALSEPLVAPKTKVKGQKAVKAKETPQGDVLESTRIKTPEGETVISKKKSDGNWYDQDGTLLSGGSRQVAIDKVKANLKTKATAGAKAAELAQIDADTKAGKYKPGQEGVEKAKVKDRYAAAEEAPIVDPAPKPTNESRRQAIKDAYEKKQAVKKEEVDENHPDNSPDDPPSKAAPEEPSYPLDADKMVDAKGRPIEGVNPIVTGGKTHYGKYQLKGGINKAGEAGIVHNPFSYGKTGSNLSQTNSIIFKKNADGSFTMDAHTDSGKKTSKKNYGTLKMPMYEGESITYEQAVDVFGKKIADQMNLQEVGVTGRVTGLTSADFSSKFGSESGAILDPRAAMHKAADKLEEVILQPKDKKNESVFDRFTSQEADPVAKPDTQIQQSKPLGEGRLNKETADVNKELKAAGAARKDGLLPIYDSISGKEIPENIKANAKTIYERITSQAKENNAEPPSQALADDIAKVPEQYVPFFSDMASRIPILGKIPGGQTFSDIIGVVAKGVRNRIGLSEDNIGDVYKPLLGKIREMDYKMGTLINTLSKETRELGDLARKSLTPEEFNLLDAAALSGDRDRALAVFRGKAKEAELVAAFDRNVEAKKAAREMLIEAGRDVGEVDNYFQRIITDRDGLLNALGRERSVYDDAVRAAEKAKGHVLDDAEKNKILNDIISGSFRGSGPGFLQSRKLDEITQDLLKFYEPFDVSDDRWTVNVARDVINRMYFGKVEDASHPFTSDSSFGQVVGEGLKSGAIRNRGLEMIKSNMIDLFHSRGRVDRDMAKAANAFRKAQTYAYLADAGTALVQFADIFSIFREYGWKGLSSAYGKGMPQLAELGVRKGHNPDVDVFSRASKNPVLKTLEKPFQWSMKNLIGRADELQKSASTRAAASAIHRAFNDTSSALFIKKDREYSGMFPEKWGDIKKSLQSADFKNGKWDDNAKFFLFNELSNLQPISSSGRAQGFNAASPWVKVLYSLRSYPIKQVGILRNQAYNEIKRGDTLRGFAALASYMTLVAVGQQVFQFGKDKALQRDVPPEEYAAAGLLQLALIPRYSIYRAKQVGLATAGVETLVPGVGLGNDLFKDGILTAKWATDHRTKGKRTVPTIGSLLQNAESTKYIPAVGREVYALAGKGKLKEEKERDRKSRGGAPRPTVGQELINIISPPDTDSR